MVRFASALPNAEFCTADNETCNASALSRAQTVSSVLGSSASAESKGEERERERESDTANGFVAWSVTSLWHFELPLSQVPCVVATGPAAWRSVVHSYSSACQSIRRCRQPFIRLFAWISGLKSCPVALVSTLHQILLVLVLYVPPAATKYLKQSLKSFTHQDPPIRFLVRRPCSFHTTLYTTLCTAKPKSPSRQESLA